MRNWFALLTLLSVVGCESEVQTPAVSPKPAESVCGTAYDQTKTGNVTGRVTWNGPIPTVPEMTYHAIEEGTLAAHTIENPNRPRIKPKTCAVAGAVVFLQGIDPATGRPWDLPPVAVEIGNGKITVAQGERRDRVGFVRVGDAMSVTSTEPKYHVLRGRGDAFFSLALPAPELPVSRTLTAVGRVELSSGSNQYWARGDVFVSEHPYFTATDAQGQFTFNNVPAGAFKVVAWLPGWETARIERDADSTLPARMTYSAPIERVTPVTLAAGQTADVSVALP